MDADAKDFVMIEPADEALPKTKAKAAKKPSARSVNARKSLLAKLAPEEFLPLRLDEAARADFDLCAKHFEESRTELQAFDGEDVFAMESDRYDAHSAAQAQQRSHGMAVVHFLAPRILRLRDGEAKRKWRSYLAKFRKEEKLV